MPVRFQVDPDFYDHPKSIGLSDAAVALWTRAGSYSAAKLLDGFIAEHVLSTLSRSPQEAADELVARGLWRRVRGGCQFRDDQYPRPFAGWRNTGPGVRRPRHTPTSRGRRRWIPRWLREAVYERDGRACVNCGSTQRLSLDHVVHYHRGGPDTLENLRTYCLPCNWARGVRD